jgi:hypothetical protein
MRAGIDKVGNVAAWESELHVPDGAAGFVALVGSDLAGLDSLGKLNPGGVLNDLAVPYVFPNVTTTAHRLASTPLRPAWIRSPGRLQNTFANESCGSALNLNPFDLKSIRMLRRRSASGPHADLHHNTMSEPKGSKPEGCQEFH